MSDWEVSGNLIANNQQLNGASYSGSSWEHRDLR